MEIYTQTMFCLAFIFYIYILFIYFVYLYLSWIDKNNYKIKQINM